MATIAGTIKSLSNGTFHVKDEIGNIRVLQVGDTIYENDTVYGDNSNSSNSKIEIELSGNDVIVLSEGQKQLIDSSLIETAFGTEELYFTREGLNLNPDSYNAQEDVVSDLRDAEFKDDKTEAIEENAQADNEDVTEEETTEGEEEAEDETTGEAQFQARDGDATNVESDLRDASFRARTQTFIDREMFKIESEDRLSFEDNPGTSDPFTPTDPITPTEPARPSTPPREEEPEVEEEEPSTPETPTPPIIPEPEEPTPNPEPEPEEPTPEPEPEPEPEEPTPDPEPEPEEPTPDPEPEPEEPTPDPDPDPEPEEPTPPPAPRTVIKIVASDENGNPLKDDEGNYLSVNEAPEGDKAYYVALAFEPGTTVFNDDSKLETQEGTIDFTFTDGTATRDIEVNAPEGSNDYKPQDSITSIDLGTAVSIDALDDYLSDNGETLTVKITNFTPVQNSQYGATTVSNSGVITTITDNPSKINEPDTSTDPDDPTSGSYDEEDTIYAIIVGPESVNEGDTTTEYTVKLVDKDGNPVIVTEETDITVTFTNDTTENEDTQYSEGDTITVTIPANGSSNTFTVDTIDDIYKDDEEVYNLEITDIENTGEFENIKIGDKDGNYKDVDTTIYDNTTPNTESDTDSVKIVLVAVTSPATTIEDITDSDGKLIITNTNITSEGGNLYYIPVAIDNEGKPLSVQDGQIDLSYGITSDTSDSDATAGSDYISTKINTNIGEVFSVKTIIDTQGEVDENFTVTISNPQDTSYETPIVDDDNKMVTSTIEDSVYVKIIHNDEQIEGNDLTHTLQLVDKNGNPIDVDIPSGEKLIVTLQYSDDETVNADYSSLHTQNGAITIEFTGTTNSYTITNKTLDDFMSDNDENYTLTITDFTQSSTSYEKVGIDSQDTVTGKILDGVTLGDPTDAYVDEDDFDMENSVTTITDTKSLNIVSPDGDNEYKLLFDESVIAKDPDDNSDITLTSNGQNITFNYSTEGKIIATRDDDGKKVFEITLNKNGIGGSDDNYTYTQYENIDHPDVDSDDDVVLNFGYKITDQGQTSSVQNFTVTVNDSLPSSTNQNVTLDEDTTKIIYISDESFDGGVINLDNGVDSASDVANGDSIDIYDTAKDDVVGTLKNNGDGTLTFTPNDDYSGETSGFTYNVSDADGDTATATVGITVKPVADAPTLENKTVETWEDANIDDVDAQDGNQREGENVKVLGLEIPVKEDQIDQNDGDRTDDLGTTLGDNPERLGAIEFSFATSGDFGTATIGYDTNGDGTLDGTLQTITKDSTFTVIINDVDNYHVNGQTGDYSLTQAQYESIAIMHDEDNATNIKTKIAVASHEVDENGNKYSPDIVSNKASQIVTLDIKAVTDEISELLFTNNSDTYTYIIPD